MEEEKKEKNQLSLNELLSRAENSNKTKKFIIASNYYFLALSRYISDLQKDEKNFKEIISKYIFCIILLTDSTQKQKMINFAMENNNLQIFNFKTLFHKISKYELIYEDDYQKISQHCPDSHKNNNFEKAFFEHNLFSLSKVFSNISFDSAENFFKMKMEKILDYIVQINSEGKINVKVNEKDQFIVFSDEPESTTSFDKQIQQFCLDIKKLGEYINIKHQ